MSKLILEFEGEEIPELYLPLLKHLGVKNCNLVEWELLKSFQGDVVQVLNGVDTKLDIDAYYEPVEGVLKLKILGRKSAIVMYKGKLLFGEVYLAPNEEVAYAIADARWQHWKAQWVAGQLEPFLGVKET